MKLGDIKLDKSSAIPLYEQLRQALQDAITTGQLPAGSKMPTEEELCAQFNISRPVVRQAYNKLIEDDCVERMRGRGTFVRTVDLRSRYINKQLSFAEEMAFYNLPHRTTLIRQEWVTYQPELFSKLHLERNQRCLHLVRMRYVSEKPHILVENYIPEYLCPGIEKHDFAANSLYKTLNEVYGERIVNSRRTIKALTANAEFSELFGVRRGSPVLSIENVSFDQLGRPIDYSREYLDGVVQKFEFDVVNKNI